MGAKGRWWSQISHRKLKISISHGVVILASEPDAMLKMQGFSVIIFQIFGIITDLPNVVVFGLSTALLFSSLSTSILQSSICKAMQRSSIAICRHWDYNSGVGGIL